MKNRRKQIIVLAELQKRIVVRATLLPCLALIAIAVTVAVQFGGIVDQIAQFDVEISGLSRLLLCVVFAAVAMCALTVWQAVYFSHHIAGPVYRITKSMREFGDTGATPSIKLRKGDFLTEVADEFNRLRDRVVLREPAGTPQAGGGDPGSAAGGGHPDRGNDATPQSATVATGAPAAPEPAGATRG